MLLPLLVLWMKLCLLGKLAGEKAYLGCYGRQ